MRLSLSGVLTLLRAHSASGRAAVTVAALLGLALKVSIALNVFALGVGAEPRDAIYLIRQPSLLLRSLLSVNIIMPVCAVAFALAFALSPAVEAALVSLAVSPVPPTLPKKQIKKGGHASYAIGLLVVEAVLAIAFVPAVVPVLGWIFHTQAHISMSAVAMLVLEAVLIPVALGMLLGWLASDVAKRIAGPVALIGTVLLAIGMLLVLFTASSDIVSLIGNGTVLAIAAFSVLGLAVGHVLGGPNPNERVVLALSSATRHPGVALAIAASFASPKMVLAATLLFTVVGGIVRIPYLRWIEPRLARPR